jgi:phage repressor protein C with HTH and peptisase S24 domain
VLDLSKPKYTTNGEWFVFAKGGQGENSVKKLKRLYDNLEILKNNKLIE